MTLRKFVLASALMLLGLTPVLAQDEITLPANTFMAAQSDDEYLAKDLLIGAKVRSDEGKIIGDIEDVILNTSNRVVGVVIGTGGFLGIAEKRVGINLDALTFTQDDGKTTVTLPGVTKAHLKAVAAFERQRPKKSLLERAMEKARELTDKSADTASDAYKKSKKKAGPALQDAKTAVGKAYQKAKKATGAAYDKAKAAAQRAMKQSGDGDNNTDPTPQPDPDKGSQ